MSTPVALSPCRGADELAQARVAAMLGHHKMDPAISDEDTNIVEIEGNREISHHTPSPRMESNGAQVTLLLMSALLTGLRDHRCHEMTHHALRFARREHLSLLKGQIGRDPHDAAGANDAQDNMKTLLSVMPI